MSYIDSSLLRRLGRLHTSKPWASMSPNWGGTTWSFRSFPQDKGIEMYRFVCYYLHIQRIQGCMSMNLYTTYTSPIRQQKITAILKMRRRVIAFAIPIWTSLGRKKLTIFLKHGEDSANIQLLVGGLEHFLFFHILGIIIPID